MPHIDLLELPYFEGISIDALVSLVDLMNPVQFPAGETIVKEGDQSPQALFIATSGTLLITKADPGGKQRELAKLGAPTLFGEIELFCQIRPVCTAKALTPIAAFKLDRPTFDQLFKAKNTALMQFTFNVARVACHRLAIADELLAQAFEDKDLITMREAVWSRMTSGADLSNTTGIFKRDELTKGRFK